MQGKTGKTFEFRNLIYQEIVVSAKDGTPITVQCVGNPQNPPVLLANGIGVRWYGLYELTEYLSEKFYVLLWDYRGIGKSIPVIKRDFSLPNHAKDAVSIMKFFDYKKYHLIGWSMGVPVLLEIHKIYSEKIDKMALLMGSPGEPFKQLTNEKINNFILNFLNLSIKNPYLARIIHKVSGLNTPVLEFFLKSIGFSSFKSDSELFDMCVKGVLSTDVINYSETLLELGRYSAWDYLYRINNEVFVAASGKDITTSVSTMKKASKMLDNSVFYLYSNASHFTIMEENNNLFKPLIEFLS